MNGSNDRGTILYRARFTSLAQARSEDSKYPCLVMVVNEDESIVCDTAYICPRSSDISVADDAFECYLRSGQTVYISYYRGIDKRPTNLHVMVSGRVAGRNHRYAYAQIS